MANMVATVTYNDIEHIRIIEVNWTSDDTAGTFTVDTVKIVGTLLYAVTDPGSAAPTADYDITIKDAEATDVLSNCTDNLVDRHTTASERMDFVLTDGGRPVVSSVLTIAGAGCGNAKTGQLLLYWVRGVVA